MNKMIVMAASMAVLNVLAECPKEAAPCACPKEAAPCACAPCKCDPCECPKKAAQSPEAMAAEYEACIRKGVEQGMCTEATAKKLIENYRTLSPKWQKAKLETARKSLATEKEARASIQNVEDSVNKAINTSEKREAEDSARAPQL